MKTISKPLVVSAVMLGLALFPVSASASPVQTAEVLPLSQHAEPYHPAANDAFDLGEQSQPAVAALPARGTFTAVVVPRVSYPVADTTISSGWGPRTCPDGPCSTFHQGVDFPGAAGAPIKSIAAGTVSFVGPDGNYGNKLIVEHNIDGVPHRTVYAHMLDGSFAVHPGQVIERGQLLGGIGNTGRSYGNHLHFEVHVNGNPVDPAGWMAAHNLLPFS